MKKFRFHVVGLPHTKATKEFSPCAYTQKVLNFCKMMTSLGHDVYHYGGEGSEVDCVEHISIVTNNQRNKWFGNDSNWKKGMFNIKWDTKQIYWQKSNQKAIIEIKKRCQQRDFLCLIGGNCQKEIADSLNLECVEFGVGYEGIFSKYRVFESYAWMHHVYGIHKIHNGQSFDCVIPNYFNPKDFPFSSKSEDYYLYIGRMVQRKGVIVASEAVKIVGGKLKMAGQGLTKTGPTEYKGEGFEIKGTHIEYLGTVGVKDRGTLMSKAKAVIIPTQYIEPFGGVCIEANLCGTPVITTDWGSFSENVIQGVTGFRCRTMGETIHACNNVNNLDRKKIRDWAIANYSIDRVKFLYQAYFEQLYTLWGEGYYSREDFSQYNRYGKIIV